MSDAQPNWYAVYVRSRSEFAAETQLSRKGVRSYLPSVRRLRHWKDRKVWLHFPLFPSYLFVNVPPTPQEFTRVLRTHGVVRLLGSPRGAPASIPPDQILYLQMLINSGKDLNVYAHLQEGASVRIRKGVLEGSRGVLCKKPTANQCLFAVNIEILGRCVCVMINPDDLEPA